MRVDDPAAFQTSPPKPAYLNPPHQLPLPALANALADPICLRCSWVRVDDPAAAQTSSGGAAAAPLTATSATTAATAGTAAGQAGGGEGSPRGPRAPVARMCHTMTALSDGRVLVVGGRRKEGAVCMDAW